MNGTTLLNDTSQFLKHLYRFCHLGLQKFYNTDGEGDKNDFPETAR